MLRFTFCVIGIYTCFLTWGVLQERVSTTPYYDHHSNSSASTPNDIKPEKFTYFNILNTLQCIIAALIAWVYLSISARSKNQKKPSNGRTVWKPISIPSKALVLRYVQVALLNALASPFGYESLKHIDYPTMILGKSCKLVPVMLMNVLLYGRKYPAYKYASVGLITAGVSAFFLLHESGTSGKISQSSVYGLVLLLINLIIDGATNSTQDQIFANFAISGQEMMFFMNLLGGLLISIWLINPLSNEFANGLVFIHRHPQVLVDLFLFATCGGLGQCFIFYTLEHYGSLSLVTVTVTRKLFTILISVFYFNHILSISQWASVGLVFVGIALEAYCARRAKLVRATATETTEKAKTQ